MLELEQQVEGFKGEVEGFLHEQKQELINSQEQSLFNYIFGIETAYAPEIGFDYPQSPQTLWSPHGPAATTGEFSDVSDYLILTTGTTVHREPATESDVFWAKAGVFVPFVGGGILKKIFTKGDNLVKVGDDIVDELSSGVTKGVDDTSEIINHYSPVTDVGPLPDVVAKTFKAGSYTGKVLTEPTVLYRVYGGDSGQLGSYWSRTEPIGPLQSKMDLALPPGNTAEAVVKIEVPAGTKIFEGTAEASFGYLGGGSQVYINNVSESWIVQ